MLFFNEWEQIQLREYYQGLTKCEFYTGCKIYSRKTSKYVVVLNKNTTELMDNYVDY